MSDFREADWKILRELAKVALERFCKRVLDEAGPIVGDSEGQSGNYHKRYLALYKLIHRRDDELAFTFNDLKRSMARFQLASMWRLQLLTEEEFMRFSQETRDAVQSMLALEI